MNFVSDHDVSILNASGKSTLMTVGDNLLANSVTLGARGYQYDLIVVAGDMYRANVISQANILLDDDYLSATDDFGTTGVTSASMNGNLLWNQASIHTIGDMQFADMPAEYMNAAAGLADGDNSSLSGVVSDSAFEGLASLRVLYVEGSVFDLQYIKQTNVLGDNDQIILAADTLQTNSDADWTINTGSNTLLNNARILDSGEDSMVYVGGEQYSDALLYQANLIEDVSALAVGAPDQLAAEAVVFLADDMLETTDHIDQFTIGNEIKEETSVDALQSQKLLQPNERRLQGESQRRQSRNLGANRKGRQTQNGPQPSRKKPNVEPNKAKKSQN